MSDTSVSPNLMKELPNTETDLATKSYSQLQNWIDKFKSSLEDRYEIVIQLTTSGNQFIFRDMELLDNSLIIFHVTTLGEHRDEVKLIQHISQLSVVLRKIPIIEEQDIQKSWGESPILW